MIKRFSGATYRAVVKSVRRSSKARVLANRNSRLLSTGSRSSLLNFMRRDDSADTCSKSKSMGALKLSTIMSSAAVIAESPVKAAAAATVVTKAGFAMAPWLVPVISNAPLPCFFMMQASGMDPIRYILKEKKTADYSPFPFVSLYTNCAVWTLYGWLKDDTTILVANGMGVIAGVAYTLIFARHTHVAMSKFYIGSGAILGTMLSSPFWAATPELAADYLGKTGCCAAVILMASPLAVISTVIKNKETAAMSLAMSAAIWVNAASWTTYGWTVTGDPYVWAPNFLGVMSANIQLALFAIYPRSNPNKAEEATEEPTKEE